MNNPICFSQYFVNKQNVRSFNNILNSKLLKSENYTVFLKNIFEDEELVSELSTEVKETLFEIRENIKSCSKNNFKNYLILEEVEHSLQAIRKSDIVASCSNALVKVIPVKFFGNNHNNKIFNKCTKLIIYSMRNQYLYFENLIQRWDFTRFPWNTIISTLSAKILCHILHWIFKIVLSAIISLNFYVISCKLDTDENKLHFFLKNQWQSYYDIRISNMIISKIISRFEPYSMGKKTKKKYSLQERIKLKILKKETSKLHLVLKCNNDYRPIVRYKNEKITSSEKYKIKERLHFLQILTGKSYEKIEKYFPVLYTLWIKKDRPKLYFVKTDLSNAFGSISKEKLLKILCERHVEFQNNEKSLYVKKKFAQQYKEMVAELRKPLLIRAGSTIYEWKEGLVQGYKYSPALSELYYSYLDKKYFSEHLERENHERIKLFIRVVDDYLYITDSLEDAHLFLKALSNYRNVNFIKTFVNFQHPTIKYSQEITFLGYNYNTVNMEVSRANTVFTGDMCYKINFSLAVANLDKFLENRIGQSGIQINSHIFNFFHHNEKLIWHHIFVTLCLSANKFCTILAIYCDEKQFSHYLTIYKNRVTVRLCNSIIETLKRNQPPEFTFKYCINHFRYLSSKALLLCAQQTPKCNLLVPYVNVELAKTNCINGKWKDHSSIICKNGKSEMQAVREICKRADLKIIMKSFNQLPTGVQCFDHKRFYQ